MNKYITLFFILSFNLFSYEIQFYGRNVTGEGSWRQGYFFDNDNGILSVRYVYNGQPDNIIHDSYTFFIRLGYIKSNTQGYISSEVLNNILKEENQALNDFYIQQTQPFLNFLYNNNFSSENYIYYENYELLYNADGLAVESIVDGVWAGIYSDSEKSSSGYFYNSGGTLIYYNGEKVSWIQSAIDKVLQGVIGNLHTLIRLISTPVGVCVSVVFVLCIVYYVVEVGRRAIKPIDDNIRKRNLK